MGELRGGYGASVAIIDKGRLGALVLIVSYDVASCARFFTCCEQKVILSELWHAGTVRTGLHRVLFNHRLR